MTDEYNRIMSEAGPSEPVRVAGWRDSLPSPGEKILEVDNEHKAQRVINHRLSQKMEQKAMEDWVSTFY
ncbi:unnamed protein product [Anisakis simplex]|uniref:Translation initiation factor IF-2, mitochondrial (inferred by orthology to a human protein) n=1 Tax=Anisakis simplex TaxID=6269 RepID=A0A0M3JQF6_ANISI|nr:unnamed protein product [Anisakis simplex]